MKDFPILTKKVISDNEILFEFDCGDLWYRKNADKSEDIDKSIDLFKKELPALKGKKFEKLNLKMKYTAPHSLQLDELKEGSDNKYKVEDVNYHILYPLIYGDEDFGTDNHRIFYVGEDLINADYEFVSEVANLLKDLKVIHFWTLSMTDGFLASGTEDDEFIRSELNNPQWDSQFMEIKENFIEPDEKMGEKFGNDLDGLMYIKKNLDHNIEFQFNHIDKEEEEILRKHNII
tara:strand:+ start:22 stop:720 length:699 start_codon:yes stop_codon:yes gene_type:complete